MAKHLTRSPLFAFALFACVVSTHACAGQRDAGSDETSRSADMGGVAPGDDQASMSTTADSRVAPGGALGDAEILAVVRTVNSGEVAAGELATQKAAGGDTRQLAQHLIADHTEGNEKVSEIALAIPPRDNQLSQTLREQAAAERETLEGHSGEEFDRAFVESQARMHQQVLDTIDRQLLPAVTAEPVRELLESTREQVASHLEHARELQGGAATGG
jgi:putative membrane protein